MVKVLILKKRKDFVRAAKGFKTVTPSLILQAAQSLSAPYRNIEGDKCFLGYTATKKIGKAHLRNRSKRRLRAAARDIFSKYGLPQTDYVLVARYSTVEVAFKSLRNDMKFALKRTNKLICQDGTDETAADSAD